MNWRTLADRVLVQTLFALLAAGLVAVGLGEFGLALLLACAIVYVVALAFFAYMLAWVCS